MIADLALSMMEFQFLNAKSNLIPKDSAIFRYIDDILSINFDFDAIKDIMYPSELQLNTEKVINNKINYLDITLQMGEVNVELYNKTDVFNFNVIRSFSGNSCVHSRMIKGVIIGQCLRFCRLIHEFESWIDTTKLYLYSLHRNGHTTDGIIEGFVQFTGKYNKELWKYNIHSKSQAIKRIINPSIQMLTPHTLIKRAKFKNVYVCVCVLALQVTYPLYMYTLHTLHVVCNAPAPYVIYRNNIEFSTWTWQRMIADGGLL